MMIGTKRRNKHTRWQHMAHASSSASPSQPWNCGALYRECESLCQDSLCKVKAKTKIDLKPLAYVLSLLSCSHVYAFKRRFYILLTSHIHLVLMINYDYYSQYGQFNMRSFVTIIWVSCWALIYFWQSSIDEMWHVFLTKARCSGALLCDHMHMQNST